MEELIKGVLSGLAIVLGPMLAGGGVLALLVNRFQRRDLVADRSRRELMDMKHRGKLYELSYRLQDAHFRNVYQIFSSLALAYREEDEQAQKSIGTIAANMLTEKSPSGEWSLKPFPNFVEQAHQELRLQDDEVKR